MQNVGLEFTSCPTVRVRFDFLEHVKAFKQLITSLFTRYEVLTAVLVRLQVLWDVKLCQ
jgi:hypothetical protein